MRLEYIIYGLRLRGDTEARYIGLTTRGLERRLAGHVMNCRAMPVPTLFAEWLLDDLDQVEIFQIDYFDDERGKAFARERDVMRVCLALGHRLFNRHGVPAADRIPRRNMTQEEVFAASAEWHARRVRAMLERFEAPRPSDTRAVA